MPRAPAREASGASRQTTSTSGLWRTARGRARRAPPPRRRRAARMRVTSTGRTRRCRRRAATDGQGIGGRGARRCGRCARRHPVRGAAVDDAGVATRLAAPSTPCARTGRTRPRRGTGRLAPGTQAASAPPTATSASRAGAGRSRCSPRSSCCWPKALTVTAVGVVARQAARRQGRRRAPGSVGSPPSSARTGTRSSRRGAACRSADAVPRPVGSAGGSRRRRRLRRQHHSSEAEGQEADACHEAAGQGEDARQRGAGIVRRRSTHPARPVSPSPRR